MSSIIRLKFRHLTLFNHGDAKRARLVPVMPRTKWDPDGSEENRRFWAATPSGEGEVPVEWLPVESREPGSSCVYVDLQLPAVPGAIPPQFAAGEVPWTLTSARISPGYGHLAIELHPLHRSGSLWFDVHAPGGVLLLLPTVAALLRARAEWRSLHADDAAVWAPPLWRVDFLPAP